MKLLKGAGGNCLLTSAAMLLDTTEQELINEIGHDGSEVWWPKAKATDRKRNFHIQEIIDCCMKRGYGLMPIDLMPCSMQMSDPNARILWDQSKAFGRFTNIVNGRPAILIGETLSHIPHACAWDGFKVFDPRGMIQEITDYTLREAWIIMYLNK
jgi:hypothetical protein